MSDAPSGWDQQRIIADKRRTPVELTGARIQRVEEVIAADAEGMEADIA